ncbi:MAG TPA: hypothetical protein VL551_27510 [Actinospica sp.]|jgi:hypothetical protein|nr:hypothetical protein [Actinospica sp.]
MVGSALAHDDLPRGPSTEKFGGRMDAAMVYAVRTTLFDTELHARWAFLFDQVGVPWMYKPVEFSAGDRIYSPAFYLPRFRLWFEAQSAEAEPPWWWDGFAAEVELWCDVCGVQQPCSEQHPAESTLARHLLGQALLISGPFPRHWSTGPKFLWKTTPPLRPGKSADPVTADDSDEFHSRLGRAYETAAAEWIREGFGESPDTPVRRKSVIQYRDADEASERCCACGGQRHQRPVDDPAPTHLGEETASIHDQCPGCLCEHLTGSQGATSADNGRVCRAEAALTDSEARYLLNDFAWKLSQELDLAPNQVNVEINREIRARRRADAELGQIAAGLNTVVAWLGDLASFPTPSAPARPRVVASAAPAPAPAPAPRPAPDAGWTSYADLERRYAPVRGAKRIKPQATPTAPAPVWSTDPCLFDAFMRLWIRWVHGVGVNWTREECTVLTDVIVKGLNVKPARRGAQDTWKITVAEARFSSWPADELLGYVLDSIDHGFSCNLNHKAAFQVLELAGRACGQLRMYGEAKISHQIWELTRAWEGLRSPDRMVQAPNISFVTPHSSYRASAGAQPAPDTETCERV